MSANSSIIEIFSNDGDLKPYKRLSARVPEFLLMFPVKDGWRHVREVAEASSLTPSLVAMHLAAITAGKNPSDLGLSPLPRGLVFTSRLFDPAGTEVASGSATSQVGDIFYPSSTARKDFEAAESAAFQRLLAAVGLSGEVFEEDEANTLKSMGVRVKDADDSAGKVVAFSKGEAMPTEGSMSKGIHQTMDDNGLPDVATPEEALAGISGIAEGASEQIQSTATKHITVVAEEEGVATSSTAKVADTVAVNTGKTTGHRPNDVQILAALNRQIAALSRQYGVPVVVEHDIVTARERMAHLQQSATR